VRGGVANHLERGLVLFLSSHSSTGSVSGVVRSTRRVPSLSVVEPDTWTLRTSRTGARSGRGKRADAGDDDGRGETGGDRVGDIERRGAAETSRREPSGSWTEMLAVL